jgi:hypothetical protein
MARGLWEKIEWIREQPEHIRMRYVIGCLFVSMLFIFGIWLLSVGEGFRSISKEVPAVTEKGKEMLPKDQAPSLSDLLEKATPMRVDNQNKKTDTDYFNEQFQKGTQNTNTQ